MLQCKPCPAGDAHEVLCLLAACPILAVQCYAMLCYAMLCYSHAVLQRHTVQVVESSSETNGLMALPAWHRRLNAMLRDLLTG